MPKRPAATPADAAHGIDVDAATLAQERVLLLAERSRDAVAGVLTGSLLVAWILQRHAAWYVLLGWIAIFVVVNGYRVAISRRILLLPSMVSPDILPHFLAFAAINGAWLAALSLGFFEPLPLESKLALTVLILLAVAGGAATYASYAPGYITFVALAIPPLAYRWSQVPGEAGLAIVATLIIYGAMMAGFSRYLSSVFERSVRIRFERESVVKALQVAQGESESERQKAEEASLAKSRFLANASHDLRQPAQALALYTAVLQRTATNDEQRQIASVIAQASRALGTLLNNLLDLSRLDAGAITPRMERTDLQQLIARLTIEASHASTAAVKVSYACPSLDIHSDPVLLERILRNLLHNAVKFTDSGMVSVGAREEGDWIVIEIRDTGRGIAPEHQQKVFEEFYQVENAERDREKGLGLGLSIVARLVRILGGSVHLDSMHGIGSTFSIRLPNAGRSPSVLSLTSNYSTTAPSLTGVRVLVIDDDPLVRGGMGRLLETWGAAVDAVEGIADAMRLSASRVWQLCLCDLRLRGHEDGLVAARMLKAVFPDLPIVFISGDTAPERIEMATQSGHPLLHKPVDERLLGQQIHEVLRGEMVR